MLTRIPTRLTTIQPEEKYCTLHRKGNHNTSECYTLNIKALKLKKSNPEKYKGRNTGEFMTILNNVVRKMSNVGTSNKRAKVEEE